MKALCYARFVWGLTWAVAVLLLAGCWSSMHIDDLGLVVGSALDFSKSANRSQITITNQFITSETINTVKKGGASPQQKAYINVSASGNLILPTLRTMPLKTGKRAFAQHQKVLVIGENFARNYDLEQALDFFLKEQEIRLSCLIFVAKDHANKALEAKGASTIPAIRLVQLSKIQERTTRVVPKMPLYKIIGKMKAGSSFVVQNVATEGEDVKFTGGAVIRGKTNKLIGFLNDTEIEGLTWLTGKGKGGLVKSKDQATGEPIVYEVITMKSDIEPHVNGNDISFDVKIHSKGRIAEDWVTSGKPFENQYLHRAEQAVEKAVKQLVKNALVNMQKEYQADIAGFGNRLRIKYPQVWEKVKRNWDETFSETPVKYSVQININDYGTSGSSSD